MAMRIFFCLALSLLMGSASASAQSFARGPHFPGQVFRPAPIPHNQFWGARPVFPNHHGVFFPNHFGFFPQDPFGFGFHFSPHSQFFFHHRFGGGPFFNQPFGFPFYGFGSYSYPFVSPFGPIYPQRYGIPPNTRGEAMGRSPYEERSADRTNHATPRGESPAPPAQARAEAGSDFVDPRDVVVTLDGEAQPLGGVSAPLKIGSGRHTLRITAKPAPKIVPQH